jgi:hypothetical protein
VEVYSECNLACLSSKRERPLFLRVALKRAWDGGRADKVRYAKQSPSPEKPMRAAIPAVLIVLLAGAASEARGQGPFRPGANFIGPSLSLATYGSTAAVGGHFEHAVSQRAGVGAAAEYFSYGCDAPGITCNVKYVSLAGTGAYHFEVSNPKVDPFVGGTLGYHLVSCTISMTGDNTNYCGSGSRILLGAYGGIRYFVSENMAIVGRAGYGLGYLSAGVDFRF